MGSYADAWGAYTPLATTGDGVMLHITTENDFGSEEPNYQNQALQHPWAAKLVAWPVISSSKLTARKKDANRKMQGTQGTWDTKWSLISTCSSS